MEEAYKILYFVTSIDSESFIENQIFACEAASNS